MSVFKKLEERIQGLFEGGFGRAFKSPVQPVELARKLVKEMEDHKVISVSRIYAPNEYTLFLAPDDAGQFEAYEQQLKADLADYLMEHARKENYDILSQPIIIIETDEDLQLGEFGIATRMVSAPVAGAPGPLTAVRSTPGPAPEFNPQLSQTVIYRPPPVEGTMAVSADDARELGLTRECVTLTAGNQAYEVNKHVVIIGRSKQCDFPVNDPNISRRHAELRQRGNDYMIVDLDSTNGIEVNGSRVKTRTLNSGDVLTIGTTRVRFERKLC
ncbi:MAG: FhaA domain-containing protein [Thermoleophilia bacterium]